MKRFRFTEKPIAGVLRRTEDTSHTENIIMKTRQLIAAIAVLGFIASAGAQANVVAQYSFESGNRLGDTAAGGSTADTLSYVQDTSASASGQYVAGAVGDAAVFDGNIFTAADSADLSIGSNTFTFEMFISSATVGGFDRLMLKWGAIGTLEYHFALNGGNLSLFRSTNGSDFAEVLNGNTGPATDFTDSDWHHLAVTSDGSGSTAWIDGVVVASGGAITIADTAESLGLGNSASAPSGDRYVGLMDEVRIHDMSVDQNYINGRVALLSGPAIPAPAALPAGIAMLGVLAGRRRR